MVPKTLLLLLFLGFTFSHILFSDAIPTTRSLWSHKEYSSLGQNKVVPKQNWLDFVNGEKVFGVEENEGILIEGRMDLENTMDYPGTGPNKNHDPKTPGTA